MASSQSTTATRGKSLIQPDHNLISAGETLCRQIETSYSHWKKARASALPRERMLKKLRPKNAKNTTWTREEFQRVEDGRKRWDRSRAGKRHHKIWRSFNNSHDAAYKIAKRILRMRPHTRPGLTMFAIAAFFYGDWPGFGFQPSDTAIPQILTALSRASGVRLPNGVREVVQL